MMASGIIWDSVLRRMIDRRQVHLQNTVYLCNAMKTLRILFLSMVLLSSGAQAQAQKLMDGSYGTVGYIKSDGTIQDKSYRTVGHIKSDGTVQDGSYKTIGYLKSDGTVQDASYRTVGHIKNDGTVQNGSYQTIGYVKSDGTIQDKSYRTIGYARDIPRQWAAFYFFFGL